MASENDHQIKVTQYEGIDDWVACGTCIIKTAHKLLVRVETSGVIPDIDLQWWEDYQIIQCQGCKAVSFRKLEWNSEDEEEDDDGGYQLAQHESLYPERAEGRQKLDSIGVLPPNVRNIYEETLLVLSKKAAILTGVGIRAIIEAVCVDKETKSKKLGKKINELVDMGVLTQDGSDILHTLRHMGNKAAHEVNPHTEGELNIAFDVIDHLLQSVYILPFKASHLPGEKDRIDVVDL